MGPLNPKPNQKKQESAVISIFRSSSTRGSSIGRVFAAVSICTLTVLSASAVLAQAAPEAQVKHFHPKGQPPSKYTIELQNSVRKTLPLDDKRDFEEAKRGFMAAPTFKRIMAEAGNVAWDMGSYEFLLQGKEMDSINR